MIKSITITNNIGESITITLSDTEPSTGLFITGIDGLGPVKADINLTALATADGSKYNSSRAESRNIVMHLQFLNNEFINTIEEIRRLTYRYFPLKQRITFHIETDQRIAEVEGYVESNEPTIFEEETGAEISILCESAWFKDGSPNGTQEIDFSDIASLFEFEFSDDDSPSIEFSSIELKRENVVTYYGETNAGIVLRLIALGSFTNPIIYNNETGEKFKIDTNKVRAIVGSAIQAGDEIEISTIKNDKYVRFIRAGRSYNILNALDTDADWFEIHPGDNIFSYTAATGELNISFTLMAQILYVGV